MKHLSIFLLCAAALADDRMGRMLDEKLTAAQRNDACYALRGNRSPQVIAAMSAALASEPVRACAARSLREAGAIEELKGALTAQEPPVRAAAARELGGFQRPELMEMLARAARDPNLLVAMNAVAGLGQYQDRGVLPYLLDLAGRGGVVGIAAMSRAAQFQDPAVLETARKLLANGDVPSKLVALRIVGESGDESDLPRLRELEVTSAPLTVRSRGFGLMPPIDLSRAAKQAVESIGKRSRRISASERN